MSKLTRTIVDLMRGLFASFFPQPTWRPWVLCAAAIFGLTYGLDAEDQEFILRCLGRTTLPTTPAERVFLIVGRRGGKSRFASFLAVFLAAFKDYSGVLTKGERGVVMLIAPDRRQARTCFRYISGFFEHTPMLKALVLSKTKDSISLSNGIDIECHTASFRSVRGYTVVAAIIDEAAFLPTDDSAEPDAELIAAILPAMATTGGLLIVISSPHARRGELWRAFKEHWGQDDDPILVWKADSRSMNPSVSESLVARAYAEDEAVARSEYGAEFRSDLEAFISREVLESVVMNGRRDLPPEPGATYVAFVDPSGGAADSMTMAIGHRSAAGLSVIDVVREVRAPFDPDTVVGQFANDLLRYRVRTVHGDRYGGEWPASRFRAFGIEYRPSERDKSEIFKQCIPLFTTGKVELPDLPVLTKQLLSLERRTTRTGRELIDHPRGHGQRDDVANAVCGAVLEASGETRRVCVAVVRAKDNRWQEAYYRR